MGRFKQGAKTGHLSLGKQEIVTSIRQALLGNGGSALCIR
jgi:hypothetical protein